jgi:S-adenosylmethionine:tRNA ribosyltransferase-isomerase
LTVVDFELPAELEARAPVEPRDRVRLLVVRPGAIRSAVFSDFPVFLEPGDLLVVNTSATLAAAAHGERLDKRPDERGVDRSVVVHFSTPLEDGSWAVEVRPRGPATGPVPDLSSGERIELADGVTLTVLDPYPAGQSRLWRAVIAVDGGVERFLARHGRPIRYAYLPHGYPLADYQTVFARTAGSAEMPSAGRPFTAQIVTELVVRGVAVAPITLHTGVSSQDAGEPPLPERFAVPAATARLVNATRQAGGRVVAVGTTVTRALESVAAPDGRVRGESGWTHLVLGPDRPARVVTGLVTGWHAPGASHLQLLEAVAGADLVRRAYAEALREHYTWHEFGDSCLLLP